MLELCDFHELTEKILQECDIFLCESKEITDFFTNEYVDYARQLLGKSYCFVDPNCKRIVCAFTVANSSIRINLLPNSRRNKLNRRIPNEKRRSQYPAVLIAQLAVNKFYRGLHVGDELLDMVKSWFVEPLNKTGCRYAIVDAVNHPKVIDFYQRNGFQFLFPTEEEEWIALHGKGSTNDGCSIKQMRTRLMYFDLILLQTK